MIERYLLVIDSTAAEVEVRLGLKGRDTPLGVLIKEPPPFRLEVELEKFQRAFNPNRCICGAFAVIHQSNCPAGLIL